MACLTSFPIAIFRWGYFPYKETQMAEFASKGVGAAALTTGIIGASNWLFNGNLGNLFGGGNNNSNEKAVSRYDMGKENEITQLKMEKALLESNIYTDSKIADVYERLSNKISAHEASNNCRFNNIESQIAQQAIWNATQTGLISCMQSQIAQLQGLTKIIVPASSVCPEPMLAKNAWVAPTTGA